MSAWTRFLNIFRAKANKALDKAENPNETLDYSYQRQLELLSKTKRGLADVATSRKRVELQVNDMQTKADKYAAQAQKAIEMDREDLAREALTRKAALAAQVTDLTAQRDELAATEEKLSGAVRSLTAKVEDFRTRKETTKANYTAAQAQTRIAESLSGIGDEFGDVGQAIARAEDKTAQMQARAGAIDELVSSGALELPGSAGNDDIGRELDAISASTDIEAELAAMKALSAPKRVELEA